MCHPNDLSFSFDLLDYWSLCKGRVFRDCPIFFSLGSFLEFEFGSLVILGFDFGSLVVLEVEGFSWQDFILGLELFVESSWRF